MCKTTPPVYFNINNLRKTSETWARDRAGLPSDRLHQHHGPHLPLRTAGAPGGHGGHPPHHLPGRPPSPTGQHRQRSDGQTDRLSANDSSITRPEGQKMQKFHRAIPLTLRLTEPQLEVSWHLEIRIFITGYRTSFNKRRRKFGNSLVNVEANHEEGDSSEVPICSSKLTSVRKQNKVTSGWIWCDYWGRKKKKI